MNRLNRFNRITVIPQAARIPLLVELSSDIHVPDDLVVVAEANLPLTSTPAVPLQLLGCDMRRILLLAVELIARQRQWNTQGRRRRKSATGARLSTKEAKAKLSCDESRRATWRSHRAR